MLELLQRYATVLSSDTTTYRMSAYGERLDGIWRGYLVFVPIHGGRVLVTDQETTQRTLEALMHWAAGISPVYLEGAFRRALARRPEARLERRLEEIERLEVGTHAQVIELEHAANLARSEASLAEDERKKTERALATVRAEVATAEARLHERAAARARAEAQEAQRTIRGQTRSARSR